ncbi:hypothetical protein EA187_00880 [Lujinxingia sediminis]|uniref:peptidoglycan glycosyltransferase n=1 Tax=Lujinxingia sediminis TaxID=2480984 RepID=A0ABY0CX57_9DELT|nr:transglycosylase domain-containing protein [Lujinxingia sediminis]RVU48020.1 hypothetical protein EA187_00880 [Lujinxingia sediminis]
MTRPPSYWRSTFKRALLYTLALALLASLALAIWLSQLSARAHANLPPLPDLNAWHPELPTHSSTADGWPLTSQPPPQPLTYEELPPLLIATVLAAEDEDFFLHRGYNPRSIARAALVNLRAGGIVQGASTITQQVAKHFLDRQKTTHRKVQELLLARQLEAHYSKPEILATYLRNVYFGEQAWGITAASHRYFRTAPHDLTLGQMAMLAGILPAPSNYNPVASPELARQKRNRVLRRLHEIGVIDQDTYQREADAPLPLDALLTPAPSTALQLPEADADARQYLANHHPELDWNLAGKHIITPHRPALQALARRALQRGVEDHGQRQGFRAPPARLKQNAHTGSAPPAPANLFRGINAGNRVTPALVREVERDGILLQTPQTDIFINAENLQWLGGIEPRSQRPRDRYAYRSLLHPGDLVVLRRPGPDMPWQLSDAPPAEGALLLLDHISGDVVASVGSHRIDRSAFNRATRACRQPGSLFKTILYAEALSGTFTLATPLRDIPTTVETRGQPRGWQPRNADADFKGTITALNALVFSRNIPALHLLERLGAPALIARARRMGVSSELDPTASLALGASCVTLPDIARAHASVARGGLRASTRQIDRIVDLRSGHINDRGHFASHSAPAPARLARIAAPLTPPEQALGPRANALLHSALTQVATRGTASKLPDAWPLIAKTGTTNEFDAWIAAADPHHTFVVWVGSDKNTEPLGRGEHGGRTALPILAELYAHLEDPTLQWPERTIELDPILIDPDTGLRARPGEPGQPYLFVPGTAPGEFAPTRASRQILRLDAIR